MFTNLREIMLSYTESSGGVNIEDFQAISSRLEPFTGKYIHSFFIDFKRYSLSVQVDRYYRHNRIYIHIDCITKEVENTVIVHNHL